MEGYQMHMECRLIEDRICDSCGYCKEMEAFEAYYEQSQDYEPTDADIEAEIERQMAEEEARYDNL